MKNIIRPFQTHTAAGIVRAALMSLVLLALLGQAWNARAASSPPDRMTYQGFLVDGNGDPLAPTVPVNYPVIFRIYPESEGSADPIWSEQQIVTVDKGNFSVVLGEGTDVSGETRGALSTVFLGTTASERYMAITVTIGGNSLTLAPRLRLLPSPYAFLASQAVQLVNPSTGAAFMSLNAGEAFIPSNARFGGDLFWGSGGYLESNEGGSIELGNSLASSAFPYIDFHYGKSMNQDYNIRLINDGDGRLSLHGGRLSLGNTVANTKLSLWDNGGSTYGFGVQSSQFRLHLDTASARFSFLNAPSGSEVMTIQGSGNVGIGRSDPSAALHVNGSVKIDGANFLEFGAGVAGKEINAGKIGYSTFTSGHVLDIVGAGTANRSIRIWAENGTWMGDGNIYSRHVGDVNHGIGWYGGSKLFDNVNWDGPVVFGYQNVALGTTINGQKWIMYASNNGNCYARATFVNGSDRAIKENFEPVDTRQILEKVAQMPITSWNYKDDATGRHIGPVSQDFHAAFKLGGDDDKHISTIDSGGVALAAIKGLHEELKEKETQIEALKGDVEELRAMVNDLLKAKLNNEAK